VLDAEDKLSIASGLPVEESTSIMAHEITANIKALRAFSRYIGTENTV
jgi:hypothetical protein